MRIFESVNKFASIISENSNLFFESFPIESEATEAIHSGMVMLTSDSKLNNDNASVVTAATLGFAAHSSWLNSIIMTTAGHIDSGFSEIRRAIEFTCYAAKIKDSDARAYDWIKQRSDPAAMRRFSGQFQIPTAYTSDKYRFLRPLLTTYDIANYYGSHGNFETMLGKIHTEQGLKFSYVANQEIVYEVAPYIILSGYRIYQAFGIILEKITERPVNYSNTNKYIEGSVRKLRYDLADFKYIGRIPDPVKRNIAFDDGRNDDVLFYEMLERDKQRKSKNTN